MISFFEWFPEQAEIETLTIAVDADAAERYGIPAAQLFFSERICPNADCDCQEVLLHVVGDCFTGPLAAVFVRFSPAGQSPKVEMSAESPQSQYAAKVVRLLSDRLRRDPALVQQLRRHYAQVKKRAQRESSRQSFFEPLAGEFARP